MLIIHDEVLMVKVAIPLFGDEVSPRFGFSRQFLLASIEESSIQKRELKDIGTLAPWQLPEFLAAQNVVKVVCGGIHVRFQEELERRGIEVIWGVIGPANDALAALIKGTLQRDQFVCRGRARRGFGHRHRRGQGGKFG